MIDEQEFDTPRRSRAPWTPDQVESLNGFQKSGFMHPFTCPRDEDEKHLETSDDFHDTILIATIDAWRCPTCDYTQDWAHSFMADWAWRDVICAMQDLVDEQ